MNEQLETLDRTRSAAMDLAIAYGPRVLAAALILVAGYFAGRWIGGAVDRVLLRLDLDITVRQLLLRIARVLFLLLFGVMALQNLGVELLPLFAGLGIAGAGVALARQEVLGQHPLSLADPAPVIAIVALGESSMALAIRPWVRVEDFGSARGDLNRALVEMLRQRGISIPFPQREVRLLPGGTSPAA